jgi:acyl-CoA synthetase (AMP-forming)/AMP-acid ligase II
MEHWRHARWFNLYGPTETNVVTWYEVTRADAERLESLPIGGPWPNSEIRIVDDELREVPAGEPGELCVRGATTMTGYWGAEDDSAGAFVSLRVHPALAPRRFYRTGDVVRRDAHGLLWFLGRRDDMVKVRGHRVELAEVEAVLAGHPGLAEVAVVAVPHEQIGCELVAAATPVRGDGRPNARDVMEFCAARLPGFMQPRRVELLPSLPRTSTGKLDRRRLARELPEPTHTQ